MSEEDPFSSIPTTPNEPPIPLPQFVPLSPSSGFTPLGPPAAPSPASLPNATDSVLPSTSASTGKEGTAKEIETAATADRGTRSIRTQSTSDRRQEIRFSGNRIAQSTPMLRRQGRRSNSGIAASGETLDSTASFLGPNQSFMQSVVYSEIILEAEWTQN